MWAALLGLMLVVCFGPDDAFFACEERGKYLVPVQIEVEEAGPGDLHSCDLLGPVRLLGQRFSDLTRRSFQNPRQRQRTRPRVRAKLELRFERRPQCLSGAFPDRFQGHSQPPVVEQGFYFKSLPSHVERVTARIRIEEIRDSEVCESLCGPFEELRRIHRTAFVLLPSGGGSGPTPGGCWPGG